MKIILLDADTLGPLKELQALHDLGEFTSYPQTLAHQTLERIKDAEVVITNKVVIDRQIMEQCPKLRLICVAATGTNNIDLSCAAKLGISVKNAIGYSTLSVAQYTLAAILHFWNAMPAFDHYVKSGNYSQSGIFTSLTPVVIGLEGKTVGIIGMGNIGQQVATVLTALGAKVVYYSTSGQNQQPGYQRLNLDDLLRISDIVSIHAPLNEATRGLLHEEKLKLLKPEVILVNAGRGGILDERALASLLKAGHPINVCLDVYEKEPVPADNPLLTLIEHNHRLLLTPHIAWAGLEARQRLAGIIIQHIHTYRNTSI